MTGIGADADSIGRKKPIYVVEEAPWSAFRDSQNPYGFVAFDVDPGSPGGNTSIKATHYAVNGTLRRDQRGRAVHADAASRRLSVCGAPDPPTC